jgi:hypothetical protein
MFSDPISAALDIGSKILERVIPDPTQKAAAQLQLEQLAQSGELAKIAGQVEVNKIEAANANVFVSGWRPWVGWVCGFALAYAALLEPFARFIAVVGFGYSGAFPVIDTDLTMQILIGMLGLGGYRTFEKVKSVATK